MDEAVPPPARARAGPFHAGVRESPSPPGRGVWGEGRVGIGLPVAKFLDISPSPPAPLPVGEGREPANPLPSQREMALRAQAMTVGVASAYRVCNRQ